MTVPALVAMGHTEASASSVLRKAVSLASSSSRSASSKVVLSLGPYGATLSPGQEYAGLYPPPFGPAGFDPEPTSQASNHAEGADDAGYEAALTAFHLSRLRVFAADPDTWSAIAWLAFETIPLLREIRAIRRAVGALRTELRKAGRVHEKEKPFWIASAYPKGKIGQRDARGDPVEMGPVVEALVAVLPVLEVSGSEGEWAADGTGEGEGKGAAKEADGTGRLRALELAPIPDGMGINCTHPLALPVLVGALSGSVSTYRLPTKPWLTLYPDGGAVYDVVSKSWSGTELPPQQWAERLMALAHEAEGTGVWGGVVLGGCCKSSFEEIAALRALADRPMERQWQKSTGG